MAKYKKYLGFLILIIYLAALNSCGQLGLPEYGEKTTYDKNITIEFPDFALKYIGERTEDIAQEGNGVFLYHDFDVFEGDNHQTISWFSFHNVFEGKLWPSGNSDPVEFSLNEKNYLLEKDYSDIFGKLEENEIIIWESSDYEEQQFLRRGS